MKAATDFGSELRCKELTPSGKYLNHHIDISGNAFVNGKCVNPKTTDMVIGEDGVYRSAEIGEFYTPIKNALPPVIILK